MAIAPHSSQVCLERLFQLHAVVLGDDALGQLEGVVLRAMWTFQIDAQRMETIEGLFIHPHAGRYRLVGIRTEKSERVLHCGCLFNLDAPD